MNRDNKNFTNIYVFYIKKRKSSQNYVSAAFFIDIQITNIIMVYKIFTDAKLKQYNKLMRRRYLKWGL